MDLKAAILKERSKAQCERIVKYIGHNPERFAELMKLFFEAEYRVTQRAALPLSHCVENHPGLIRPYFKKMLNNLDKKGSHDAVIRNTLRLLQNLEIPTRYRGKLMDTCFRFIQSNDIPVAIKVFSINVLDNLSKHYPDIKKEIKLLIEERWPLETAAFHLRAIKILKG